jgi:dihydrofolate reductase
MTDAQKPRITLIVARARNGVIGKDNAMPWRIPGEQAVFKRITMGHPIVMGRKTWESILAHAGKPLPGRRSIVVSRNAGYAAPGAEVVTGLDAATALCRDLPEMFVIGGAELYRAALPEADRIILTEIDRDFDGDAFLDKPDAAHWRETLREPLPEADPAQPRGFAVDIVTYERR